MRNNPGAVFLDKLGENKLGSKFGGGNNKRAAGLKAKTDRTDILSGDLIGKLVTMKDD